VASWLYLPCITLKGIKKGINMDEVDKRRRKFLVGATSAVGAIGVAMATVPFASAMLPGAAEEAAGLPVKVDISQMKEGDQLTVAWRGRPVWIIRRSKDAIDNLAKIKDLLRDPTSEVKQQPDYARNFYRSRKPDFLVLVGICTHLGCSPTYRPDVNGVETGWPGGFFCSCHGSKFDLAGRVFKGVPAPINMEVPPYLFLNDNELLIGTDQMPQEV